MDALAQGLGRVALPDRHCLLSDHGPRVDTLVDEMDGHAGLLYACGEGVLDRRGPREGGQERGVDVDRGEPRQERGREQVHVPGADD